MATIRLTDKEVNALARKVRTKAVQERNSTITKASKNKLVQAKKIIAALDLIPDAVREVLFSYSYKKNNTSVNDIARLLAEHDTPTIQEEKLFEADIILAAKDCPTMAKLYAKLGL